MKKITPLLLIPSNLPIVAEKESQQLTGTILFMKNILKIPAPPTGMSAIIFIDAQHASRLKRRYSVPAYGIVYI